MGKLKKRVAKLEKQAQPRETVLKIEGNKIARITNPNQVNQAQGD